MSTSRGFRGPQRRFSRRAGLRAGGLGLVGASAWLAACGGGDDDSSSNSGSSGGTGDSAGAAPTPRNAQTAASGTAKRGGTITIPITGTPPLDPFTTASFRAKTQAAYSYSRLLKFKTGLDPLVGQNYEIEPDLAASVEMPSDGSQITFKLRPDAVFQQKAPVNGRAVTSEDVKLSLERFRTEARNPDRTAFGFEQSPLVTAVETPDDKTFVVKLAKPFAPIQNLFANPSYLFIAPKESAGGFDMNRDAIGSGPWVLQSLQPDVEVVVNRNPTYYDKEIPYVDSLRQVIIPDTTAHISQFQAEKLDILDVPNENRPEVERSNPKATWVTFTPTTYTFISPQQREGSPFRDVRLRRAISMMVDRKSWLDLIYLGQGPKYLTALPGSMGKWWLDPQKETTEPAKAYTFDPRAAKQLMDAAGFNATNPTRFIYSNNVYGDRFNQGAEATAGMLNQNGFRNTIVTQDYTREYISSTFLGNYEGVFYGLSTPFTDPHDYLFNFHHTASQRNHAGIRDPRLDSMLADEEKTFNEADRVKKVHEIQRYLIEQMYYIPVAVGASYVALQPWVRNYTYSPTYGNPVENRAKVWIDRS